MKKNKTEEPVVEPTIKVDFEDLREVITDIEQLYGKKTQIRPDYYTKLPPEAIEVIEGWNLDFKLGNVIKYIRRFKEKGGIVDLQKAQWYLNRFIEQEGKISNGNSKKV